MEGLSRCNRHVLNNAVSNVQLIPSQSTNSVVFFSFSAFTNTASSSTCIFGWRIKSHIVVLSKGVSLENSGEFSWNLQSDTVTRELLEECDDRWANLFGPFLGEAEEARGV